jgi:acetyl-CoA carboxylase carboxyltransferase component
VWVASNDGGSLSPVATHGFDPKLVHRIGKIARDGANLTAAAFRDNAPKISIPTATAPGALAVPMCGPTGPTGVLSVEMKAGQAVEEATVALAAIIGAQLATLTMPVAEQPVETPVTPDVTVEVPESRAQSA